MPGGGYSAPDVLHVQVSWYRTGVSMSLPDLVLSCDWSSPATLAVGVFTCGSDVGLVGVVCSLDSLRCLLFLRSSVPPSISIVYSLSLSLLVTVAWHHVFDCWLYNRTGW